MLRYCGEYYDQETDLIYLRNRYYDPSIGRFISEDTHWNPNNMIYGDKEYKSDEIKIPDINAIMQSSNLYDYCINNPMNFADPSGDSAGEILSWAWGIGAGAAALDGFLLYGDAAGAVIGVGGTILAGGILIFDKIAPLFSENSDDNRTKGDVHFLSTFRLNN